MASAEQIKSLLKSHIMGDDERFLSVTMHVAACEAKLRHGKLAVELRALVDDAKTRGRPRPLDNVSSDRRLRSDGSNLASFLYYLRRKEHSAYEMIRRTVRLVAPFFDDFILEPQALDEDKIRLEWRHRGSDAYFDASSLSDGSLRFIALATLLLQPNRLLPSLIILDEPELGLHPYAITILCSLVKQAATNGAGDTCHSVAFAAGSFRAGGRIRDRTRERTVGVPQTGPRRAGGVAQGLQPRPTVGEERDRWSSCP